MSGKAIVVAVDGPSGSGKSSVSKGVARRLGLRYLDTGAQYRAMTWWMLANGVDVADRQAVAAACGKPLIESGTDPLAPTIAVDGADVGVQIRTAEVTAAVSAVAGVQPVRDRLIALQRSIIAEALAGSGGVVAEGRDIADVVYPAAGAKIFLTASAEARAARRNAEIGATGASGVTGGGPGKAVAREGAEALTPAARPAVGDTLADLARRDAEDAKTTRPHEAAPGAVIVDATNLTLDQVIDHVVEIVERSGQADAAAPESVPDVHR